MEGVGRFAAITESVACAFRRSIIVGGRGRNPAFSSLSSSMIAERRNFVGSNPSLDFCLRSRRRKKATTRPMTATAPMEPPIIPIRGPVERPPVLFGTIEVLEEAMAERDDKGMLGGVGIARAAVDFRE